jgi:hypothetical protein
MHGEKANAIRVETARAEKGEAIINSIKNMVNNTIDCRHCRADQYFLLELDDGLPQQPMDEPKLLMLRCSCKRKKHGHFIE